ncbi:hypothetical protein ACO0K2_16555 [Undibacterium sp. MH2W]|uniref:hypothetical protein n=1 Tax=Undibacterium sp. MH2W TaxID=3413044 RepID=UPI003BF445C5
MNHANTTLSTSSSALFSDRRNHRAPEFTLLEVDPRDVIDGRVVDGVYYAEDIQSVGAMREHCPYCMDIKLQLVLRYKHVKRSHLFCKSCTRCFDALYPDGTSALIVGAMSLV